MTTREPGVRDFSTEQEEPIAIASKMSNDQYEDYLRTAREMVLVREQKIRTANREAELKSGLMDLLKEYGDPYGDEGQHRALSFPRAIRGIARFVRQTKNTTEVDVTVAEAIARQRGIYDRLFKPVMTLDDSAVLVALKEGLLTEVDVEAMFPKKTTYAFVAEKAKK